MYNTHVKHVHFERVELYTINVLNKQPTSNHQTAATGNIAVMPFLFLFVVFLFKNNNN